MKLLMASLLMLTPILSEAEDSLPLYRCFSRIRVQGDLDKVDVALDRIASVVTIENRIHRRIQDSNYIEVESIASMAGLDRDEAKSKITPSNIQKYLSVVKQPLAGIEVIFLGCSETQLKP